MIPWKSMSHRLTRMECLPCDRFLFRLRCVEVVYFIFIGVLMVFLF